MPDYSPTNTRLIHAMCEQQEQPSTTPMHSKADNLGLTVKCVDFLVPTALQVRPVSCRNYVSCHTATSSSKS
jgi:hypothetical protein